MINLVVLWGVLARPASLVELPSGSLLVALELTVRREGARAEPVPISWFDAPAWATVLDAGAELVVLGRVRRRFFRASGATQSRTEVLASRVVRGSSRARVDRLVGEAIEALEALQGAAS